MYFMSSSRHRASAVTVLSNTNSRIRQPQGEIPKTRHPNIVRRSLGQSWTQARPAGWRPGSGSQAQNPWSGAARAALSLGRTAAQNGGYLRVADGSIVTECDYQRRWQLDLGQFLSRALVCAASVARVPVHGNLFGAATVLPTWSPAATMAW